MESLNAKAILIIIFLVIGLLGVSCNSNLIEPENGDQDVPQKNIVWPSLSETAWPMHHHDPQSTGRSKHKGPQFGRLSKKVYSGISESGISTGYKTFYVGTSYTPYDFLAYNYDGNLKWKTNFNCKTTPLVSADSIVYVAGETSLAALDNNGAFLWNKKINKMVSVGLNVDIFGNLYFIDFNSRLMVFDKNGNFIWELKDDRFLNTTDSAPSFSPDGNTLYVQGKGVSLISVDIINRKIRWIIDGKDLLSAPVVDNSGNIFIIPGGSFDVNNSRRKIISVNSEGSINWEYEFHSEVILDNTEPTIDYNGNIYFGIDTLYSLNNNGNLRWKVSLNNFFIVSPLICDVDNVVFLGTKNLLTKENKVMAVNNKGKILWELGDSEERQLGVSPAIIEEGTLVYPTWDNQKGNLLIIK